MILRVAKEDSVFLYQLLEGYEGLVSYSTLDTPKERGYRDVEINVPATLAAEWQRVLPLIQAAVKLEVLP